MIDYKQIVRKRATRFLILRLLKWVPDNIMLRLQYRLKMGFWPDFKHPKRFTEKLQIYKMRYRNPLMPICVDKYRVREYVKSKGLESILNELYGVYDRAEDIPFDKLPNEYVIKTTDGSGGNNVLLVRNASELNMAHTIDTVNSWLGVKDINAGREWAYTINDKSRIIVEALINSKTDLFDYKFFCFSGHVYICQIISNRFTNESIDFYDLNWKHRDGLVGFLELNSEIGNSPVGIPHPSNLTQMVRIAETLSANFPFVRVDLYNVEGRIYFGELTFYPASGYGHFTQDDFDYELGALFDIKDL